MEFNYSQENVKTICQIITKGNQGEKALACFKIIEKLLNNILEHPQEEKYRIFKKSNSEIKSKVIAIEKSLDLMYEIGYTNLDDDKLIFTSNKSINNIKTAIEIIQSQYNILEKNESQNLNNQKQLIFGEKEKPRIVKCFVDFKRKRYSVQIEIERFVTLGVLIQKIKEALGVEFEVSKVNLHNNKWNYMSYIELKDFSKFLTDDYTLKDDNILEIIEKQPSKEEPIIQNDNSFEINLRFLPFCIDNNNIFKILNDFPETIKAEISSVSNVNSIIEVAKQAFNVYPESIKLYYKGTELSNLNTLLVNELGLKQDDTIEVKGIYFSLLLMKKFGEILKKHNLIFN